MFVFLLLLLLLSYLNRLAVSSLFFWIYYKIIKLK